MSNHHFKNKNLTLKAKGLLSLMLSLKYQAEQNRKILSRLFSLIAILSFFSIFALRSQLSFYSVPPDKIEVKKWQLVTRNCGNC